MKVPAKQRLVVNTGAVRGLDDLLADIPLLPGESADDFKTLRAALWEDLAPRGAYSRVLAGNLVGLEWEMRSIAGLIAALVKNRLRAHLEKAVPQGRNAEARAQSIETMVAGLCGAHDAQIEAKAALAKLGIDATTIVAQLYAELSEVIRPLKQELHDAEKRRRRLLADYEAVQQRAVLEGIPDAIETEDDDGEIQP